MSRAMFTPEELAELAAFDAEIDDEPGYDPEEVRAARERDFEARQQLRTERERAIAEKQREYYAANREAIAEYQREYRAANREAIAEYQREYRAANREAIAEKQRECRAAGDDDAADMSPLRAWRARCGFTGKEAARVLEVCQASISNYERGITPIPERILAVIGEAVG